MNWVMHPFAALQRKPAFQRGALEVVLAHGALGWRAYTGLHKLAAETNALGRSDQGLWVFLACRTRL